MTHGRHKHLQYYRPLAAPHDHTHTAAFGPDGQPIQRVPVAAPALYSSSIVMAKDGDGVWWPARLATYDELAWLKNDCISHGDYVMVRMLSSLSFPACHPLNK